MAPERDGAGGRAGGAMIRPPAVPPNGKVALVAPAGPLPKGAVDRAVRRVESLGWQPWVGEHARGRRGYLSGTDEERLRDLNAALRAPDNDAVWCLRGGYGTMRILQGVDWGALAERPRPLVGFSDNTALHLGAQRAGVISFHGPHPGVEHLPPFSLAGLRRVLMIAEPAGELPFPEEGPQRAETVRGGVGEGPLVGGNLSLLAATVGTPYQLRHEGALLVLEEVGEPAYRVDRLLSQLLLAGAFRGVVGIALGAFSECPHEGDPALPSVAEVLRERLYPLGIPIAAGFPFGHVEDSWTLPLGARARLDATRGTLSVLEPAVG